MQSTIDKIRIAIHYYLGDITAWSLVLSNIVVMILAIWLQWQIYTMVWIYWVENVGLGIFWFVRLIAMKNFYVEKLSSAPFNPNTTSGRIENAFFFFLNFCGFQLVFFLMLRFFGGHQDWMIILLAGAIFIFNQFFSFFYNKDWKNKNKIDYDEFFFLPYTRMIPVYAVIWAAGMLYETFGFSPESIFVLIFFIMLQTAAEVIMYIDERNKFEYQQREEKA